MKGQEVDARLEAQVAKAVSEDLVDFQRVVSGKQGSGPLAEVDIETSDFVIEATSGKGGKVPQMKISPAFVGSESSQETYHRFAPRFGEHAIRPTPTVQVEGRLLLLRRLINLAPPLRACQGNSQYPLQ